MAIDLINTRLMKHPINWVVILLMLVLAGMFGHYVLVLFDQQPAKKRLITPSLSASQLGEDQTGQQV